MVKNYCECQKNKAFTLVEILIVVIIIGILAGLMMLSAGSSTETAERTACRGDRRTIKSAYYVERAENRKTFKESLEKAMAQFDKARQSYISGTIAMYNGICHAGGTYIMTTSGDRLLIACSVKGHEGEANFTIWDYASAIAGILSNSSLNDKQKAAKLKEIFGGDVREAMIYTNDTLRTLLQEKFPNWPAVEKADPIYNILKAAMGTGEPYIQPYFLGGKVDTKEILYFVNTDNKNHGAWLAYAVYYNGKWYQKTDDSGKVISNVGIANLRNCDSLNDAVGSGPNGLGIFNADGELNTADGWRVIP